MSQSISYQGGTLVLWEREQDAPVPECFEWVKSRWRCEGYHYAKIIDWLRENSIQDNVPRWQRLKLTMHDPREAHDYQLEAIKAWDENGQQGSIVLPTGAGKTFVAIKVVHQVQRSTLVIAPTIDLLHQWYTRLANAFETDIGVYYGGEKIIEPITVTTYHSAGDVIADYGHNFKLVIYDEVHHLPAPSWGETALMSPSPLRLGLTATYPEDHEQLNGRWRVDELIGKIVYQKQIDDLVGKRLAEYRTERIRVDLTPEEREQYDKDFGIYSHFFRSRRLRETHGPNWLMELMRLSAFDRDARRALLARQRLQKLLASAQNKIDLLEKLLREHSSEQVLIFNEQNTAVYDISQRFFIPALTFETKAAERKHMLESFQTGHYKAIVTSKVLNEGLDVPEAKVAIVLGGTTSTREYIQRLGRILRKKANHQALLYEIIVRNTVDEGKAQRRRPKQGQV